MAKEPDDLVLRLLRDIRAKQDVQGATLDQVQKRVEDLYKISTHTLGVAVTAHERYESLEARVDKLSDRVDRLETKQ
jgi:polyhydroxyalkanoate synthesis regulator phasin